MSKNMIEFYEMRIKPIETVEFAAWFEEWNGKISDFKENESLLDAYLSERNYALHGWIASRMDKDITKNRHSFIKKVNQMIIESGEGNKFIEWVKSL